MERYHPLHVYYFLQSRYFEKNTVPTNTQSRDKIENLVFPHRPAGTSRGGDRNHYNRCASQPTTDHVNFQCNNDKTTALITQFKTKKNPVLRTHNTNKTGNPQQRCSVSQNTQNKKQFRKDCFLNSEPEEKTVPMPKGCRAKIL